MAPKTSETQNTATVSRNAIDSRPHTKRRLSLFTSATTTRAARTMQTSPTVCARLNRTNQRVAQLAAATTSRSRQTSPISSPTGGTLTRSSSCRWARSRSPIPSTERVIKSTSTQRAVGTGVPSKARRARLPDSFLSRPRSTIEPTTSTASACRRPLTTEKGTRKESLSITRHVNLHLGMSRSQSLQLSIPRRRFSEVLKSTRTCTASVAMSAVVPVHGEACFSSIATIAKRTPTAVDLLKPLQETNLGSCPVTHESGTKRRVSTYDASITSSASSTLENEGIHSYSKPASPSADYISIYPQIVTPTRTFSKLPLTASLALLTGKPTKTSPTSATVTTHASTTGTTADTSVVLSRDASIYTSFPSITEFADSQPSSSFGPCKPGHSYSQAESDVLQMIQYDSMEVNGILLR
ncbi:hypothetical protein IWQ61_006489 [Dispira simplex]|nr:hypothetical protein IWQ61_006489 [Dispira simplex]